MADRISPLTLDTISQHGIASRRGCRESCLLLLRDAHVGADPLSRHRAQFRSSPIRGRPAGGVRVSRGRTHRKYRLHCSVSSCGLLQDYTRHHVKGVDYPAIVPAVDGTNIIGRTLSKEEASVRGTVVRGLSAADVRFLDTFEGDVSRH